MAAAGPGEAEVGQEPIGVFNGEKTNQEIIDMILANLNKNFKYIQDLQYTRAIKISTLKSIILEGVGNAFRPKVTYPLEQPGTIDHVSSKIGLCKLFLVQLLSSKEIEQDQKQMYFEALHDLIEFYEIIKGILEKRPGNVQPRPIEPRIHPYVAQEGANPGPSALVNPGYPGPRSMATLQTIDRMISIFSALEH